jgi:hypothetical protein
MIVDPPTSGADADAVIVATECHRRGARCSPAGGGSGRVVTLRQGRERCAARGLALTACAPSACTPSGVRPP